MLVILVLNELWLRLYKMFSTWLRLYKNRVRHFKLFLIWLRVIEMFSIWLRVRANLYGIRYVFITCVWNLLRLRKNGYVFIKYHTIIVRLL